MRRPGGQLAPARPGGEVRLALLARHTRHRSAQVHLAQQRHPAEQQRPVRVGGEVLALAALVAREHRAPARVEAAQQHRARRRPTVGTGGGEDHRRRLVGRDRRPLLHPPLHLHERVGVDVTDVEPGALVLRPQRVEVHAPMVADPSASIRSRWVTETAWSMACSSASTPFDLLQVPRAQPHRLQLDERIEEARDHDHRALRRRGRAAPAPCSSPSAPSMTRSTTTTSGWWRTRRLARSRWRCRPPRPPRSRRSRAASARSTGSGRRRRRGRTEVVCMSGVVPSTGPTYPCRIPAQMGRTSRYRGIGTGGEPVGQAGSGSGRWITGGTLGARVGVVGRRWPWRGCRRAPARATPSSARRPTRASAAGTPGR